MYRRLQDRLRHLTDTLTPDGWSRGLKGIEKESLRVDRAGSIARTPHPECLGSALTHPRITTDYSEALLEFITPPEASTEAALERLDEIHRFIYACMDDELLWVTSMPCAIQGESGIPIADYGRSNVGWMKHVYRRGLGWRYGRVMQTIAGTHFNYSPPEALWAALAEHEAAEPDRRFHDQAYFGMIRNFQRYGWLVPYLFGASPAICRSFAPDGIEGFEAFDAHTWYQPHATSLRMSDIGYKNSNQAGLDICYNDLESYVDSLTRAIETPSEDYRRFGTRVDGEWRQLSTNLLQIENEYYSFVRPKQIAESGEKPTLALRRRGVRYIEIRALDLDPFESLGISASTMRFMEAFLLFCLLQESPQTDEDERARIDANQRLVACCGRQPGLRLQRAAGESLLRDWGSELLDEIRPVAECLGAAHLEALEEQAARFADPDCTPSARMLAEMRAQDEGFFQYAMGLSRRHEDALRSRPLEPAVLERFHLMAEESLAEQRRIEASDELSFEDYLERYFAQSPD